MNATELYKSDGTTAGIYYCEKCRIVHREKSLAEQCCMPVMCSCGKECQKYYTKCPACVSADRSKKERLRFENAEKLMEWNGPVMLPDSDGYFATVGDMFDEVDPDDCPEYVWTCSEKPVCHLDIDRIIEAATDDAYEDFDSDSLLGQKELALALDAFNEANKGNVCWDVNYRKCLVLQP
jgi:hypothetical protein